MPSDNDRLQDLVRHLPSAPGVYRLLDVGGQVVYVGKAYDLRKRVASYLRQRHPSARLAALMRAISSVEVTVTRSESEALLLENNLIKSLRPRYNVLLRDDKSYPYIWLSTHSFPRLAFHRGPRREDGRYFGPYPSAAAVRESLGMLQKVFQVRQCEDSFFRNRSRPCLQYQIKRCSGPCAGLIDPQAYADDVAQAVMFLEGRSQALIEEMGRRMDAAAARFDYETAALYRDRIAALHRIQERQYVSGEAGEADVVAVIVAHGLACVQVGFVRGGLNLGDKSFFLKTEGRAQPSDVLAAFLPQYYLGQAVPPMLYLNRRLPDKTLLERVFSEQAGKGVKIATRSRGTVGAWISMAETNAREALRRHLASHANMRQRFDDLHEALHLDAVPERIECFDVSHTFGEATVASCVVFDANGPIKSDYRRFNIEGVERGDDYAALEQALMRRYRRAKEGEGKLPDLLLIDGGKGQLAKAETVMEELQLPGVRLVAVAKGRERKPGKEQIYVSGSAHPIALDSHKPGFHLIQQVRDEAHRFAITAHRRQRGKRRTHSVLQDIPGIGQRRRQALLRALGGLREVARAGVEELARVPGISPVLAERIYRAFHESGG